MPETTINIVAFDIPYPANYGGIIDIFYKIKALHAQGVNVILHCFQYNGKQQQPELEKYCSQVYYYERKKSIVHLFSKLPFIVLTRKNNELLANLQRNNHPILFEGLHTCYFLTAPILENRLKIVRTHNIEHAYYKGLQKATHSLTKKMFFGIESTKLRNYERILAKAQRLISISPDDYNYFSLLFKKVSFIPAFHPFTEVTSETGSSDYFLFHGKLSVEENQKAVLFLLDEVFVETKARLVIAGMNPPTQIIKKVAKMQNVELCANPTQAEMDDLLKNAQGCVLPTFQATGLKLKLLISLFASRFVIVNKAMIENTGMERFCTVANSAEEFIESINTISKKTFTENMLRERTNGLNEFSNQRNTETLVKILREQ